MSKSDKFFQFPVSALRMPKPIDKVLDHELSTRSYEIMNYSLIATGYKVDEDTRLDLARELEEFDDSMAHWQIALLAGAKTIGVKLGDPISPSQFDHFKKLNDSDSKHLRLKRALLFEFAELTNGLSWREFAILCGVLCGIGAHQHVRLSFDYIAILAAGYSSQAQLTKSKAQLVERHVVRYTVHKLVERGFFAMVAINKRHNVYSVSLNMTALADQLFARAEKQIKRDTSTVSESLQRRIASLKESQEQIESQRSKLLDQLKLHG